MANLFLKNGNSLTTIKSILSNSVSAVITDPPYEIALAGHYWDINAILKPIWKECFRVLKPGGYLVAFGDHRMFHKTVADLYPSG